MLSLFGYGLTSVVFCVFNLNVSFGWFILDGSATDDGNIIAFSIL
jgi:hypothetical protein